MCVRGAVGLVGWLLLAGAGCSTSVPDSEPNKDGGVVPIPTDGDERCPDGGLPELCDGGGPDGGDALQDVDAGFDAPADGGGTAVPTPDVPGVPLDAPPPPDACVPRMEECNNRDDDCDGQIDEDVTQSCYTGPAATRDVGACRAGTQMCNAGMFGACVGERLPATETCNGLDDDCDGAVDENLSRACGSSTGECRPGVQMCEGGRWSTACVGERAAQTETCDGRDNNCNGSADETFACGGLRTSQTCTVCGLATERGTQTCDTSRCGWNSTCSVGTVPITMFAYNGNDPRLLHDVGESCNTTCWCRNNASGFQVLAATAPAQLGAANYHVTAEGTHSDSNVILDLYDFTTRTVVAQTLPASRGIFSGGYTLNLPFTINRDIACHLFQLRVRIDTSWAGGVQVCSLRLVRTSQYTL